MKKKGGILMLLGSLFLLCALALAAYNIHDEQRAGEDAQTALSALKTQISSTEETEFSSNAVQKVEPTAVPDFVLDPHIEMPTCEVNDDGYIGILTIPSLGLELPILSQWSDAALKIAPARFYGSVYTDDMVIAGHNYDTHFGRIPELPLGEIVLFSDIDGNVFSYEVSEILVLGPNDAEAMCTGDWDLTLFTCTWGGAERITLRLTKKIA